MNLQSIRIEFDKTASYVPLLSTITNGVNLVQKLVILPTMSTKEIQGNSYYFYLQNKKISEIFLQALPLIGNIYTIYQKALWNDPQFVLKQIEKDPSNLLRASQGLQSDSKFLLQAFSREEKVLDFISKEMQEANEDFFSGIIFIHREKMEKLQKKIENLSSDYEVYYDCEPPLEENFPKDSSEIPLNRVSQKRTFYSYAKQSFNKMHRLLEDTLQIADRIKEDFSKQSTQLSRMQTITIEKIEEQNLETTKVLKSMNLSLWFDMPGHILNGMDILVNKAFQASFFLFTSINSLRASLPRYKAKVFFQ